MPFANDWQRRIDIYLNDWNRYIFHHKTYLYRQNSVMVYFFCFLFKFQSWYCTRIVKIKKIFQAYKYFEDTLIGLNYVFSYSFSKQRSSYYGNIFNANKCNVDNHLKAVYSKTSRSKVIIIHLSSLLISSRKYGWIIF